MLQLALLFLTAQDVQIDRLTPAVVSDRLQLATRDQKLRLENLKSVFADAGCEGGRLTTIPLKRDRQPNLICTIPASAPGEIVVGAHYDSTGAGDGAADNWSGAAMLANLYQSLAHTPRRHTFRFVAFAAEEAGLKGSSAYVASLSPEQRQSIRAFVSIDTLGLGPVNVWRSVSDPGLTLQLHLAAQSLKQTVKVVNVGSFATGDHAPFLDAKIPTLVLHSITQGTVGMLHSKHDRVVNLDQPAYYDTYRLLAVYLALLDTTLEP